METIYLPKVDGLDKEEETKHSLLFDSALADTIMRQNAYEERLLQRRTEIIEREKQQSLEQLNFNQHQFLNRYLPVLDRQKDLREAALSKCFVPKISPSETKMVQKRPSSYQAPKSRMASAAGKHRITRRTASAEFVFPALRENLNDILNGYRTPRLPVKSAPSSKIIFGVKRNLMQSTENKKQTQFKAVRKSSFSDYNNKLESPNEVHSLKKDDGNRSDIKTRSNVVSREVKSPNHFRPNPSHSKTQTVQKSNFSKVRFNNVNFLANGLHGGDRELGKTVTEPLKTCLKANFGNAVPFRLGNELYLLSDVKMRQRQEAQRIRVMRTVVLAYDSVWNKRLKKVRKVKLLNQ